MGPHTGPSRRAGFTLIEVVVVMLIFAIVIAMAAAITRGITAAQKRSLTGTRMQTLDAALAQFVSAQRRLPCPADGTLASSAANAGVEMRAGSACTGNQTGGVVPWRTLGLTENDATDGWERRYTYRVGSALAGDSGMDMSWCDPAGTEPPTAPAAGRACVTTCVPTNLLTCTPPSAFLPGKGLQVQNVAGTVLMDPNATPHTGAAYVIISAGETGGGGYLSSGQLGSSTIGDGTQEQRNYASGSLVVGTYYVDNALTETADATHFDDYVSRPSVLAVISKAGLGPRAH